MFIEALYVFFIASSLSISQSILFGDILCLMLVTILHRGLLPSLSSSDPFEDFLFAWSIYWSLWVVILGHTPILEFIDVLQIFSHYSIYFLVFVSRHIGAYPLSAFLLGHTPSLWVYRVSCWFHGCQTHLSIFTGDNLGHPPIFISFRAFPYCHFV